MNIRPRQTVGIIKKSEKGKKNPVKIEVKPLRPATTKADALRILFGVEPDEKETERSFVSVFSN